MENPQRCACRMRLGTSFFRGREGGSVILLQRRADPWKKLAASRVRVLAAHDALHKGRNHGLEDHE